MEPPVNAKAALLQVLISGPSYGLELIDRVSDRTEGKIRLHEGSVYPALRALEREGLVRSYSADPLPERGGRPRRYYELTAEGSRAALQQQSIALRLFSVVPVTS